MGSRESLNARVRVCKGARAGSLQPRGEPPQQPCTDIQPCIEEGREEERWRGRKDKKDREHHAKKRTWERNRKHQKTIGDERKRDGPLLKEANEDGLPRHWAEDGPALNWFERLNGHYQQEHHQPARPIPRAPWTAKATLLLLSETQHIHKPPGSSPGNSFSLFKNGGKLGKYRKFSRKRCAVSEA